jgi:HAD superfamily hydrolase (TIGR01549 family)
VLHDLVCFDAGFTLIQPRRSIADNLAAVLEAHGHRAGPEDIRRAWEAADAWFWETYHQPGNAAWTNDVDIEATWRRYHGLMLQHLGFGDREHELIDAILEGHLSAESWQLYPDTLAALELVQAHPSREGRPRPRVAVISDFGSALADVMQSVGLAPYLDVLLISAVEGMAKPAPEFFWLACGRAGVEPGDAVMIGDSYRADVVGARSAGLDAVLLDRNATATQDDVAVARTLPEAVELAAASRSVPAP